ncbi:MAG: GNAT family N-acetyltransferase [Chromatiales bacterium]|jgi:hypothetical protein
MGASARTEPHTPRAARRLYVDLAAGDDDVRASQALCYRVFPDELGARLPGAETGVDADRFHPHCHYLLVRKAGSAHVVASKGPLSVEQAVGTRGSYSESELGLSNIEASSAKGFRLLEIGRTCVDPGLRGDTAIAVPGVRWADHPGGPPIHLRRRIEPFGALHRRRSLFGPSSAYAPAGRDRRLREALPPRSRWNARLDAAAQRAREAISSALRALGLPGGSGPAPGQARESSPGFEHRESWT